MLNKAVIFVLSIFLLSSCATGPEGYFKKSANNKLFDTKGAKGGKRGKKPKEKQNKTYPVLVRNSPRADDRYLEDNSALRAELDQIKTMLNETKNEMANYRCPTAQELEKAQTSSRSSGKNTDNRSENSETGSKQKSKSISPAKTPDPSNEADTTESVKSI